MEQYAVFYEAQTTTLRESPQKRRKFSQRQAQEGMDWFLSHLLASESAFTIAKGNRFGWSTATVLLWKFQRRSENTLEKIKCLRRILAERSSATLSGKSVFNLKETKTPLTAGRKRRVERRCWGSKGKNSIGGIGSPKFSVLKAEMSNAINTTAYFNFRLNNIDRFYWLPVVKCIVYCIL